MQILVESTLPLLYTPKYMSDTIEHYKQIPSSQKFLIKLKSFLKKRAIAYAISGAVGAGSGVAVQQIEREATGYDPGEHAAFLDKTKNAQINKNTSPENDFSQFKKEQENKTKNTLQKWFKDTKEKLKALAKNPKDFVENTETFVEIKLKYLNVLKFIDDAAFLAPALLMFVMLGGYISRKLDAYGDDIVDKKEKQEIGKKLNELIDAVNGMREEIESGKIVSPERVRSLLQEGGDLVKGFEEGGEETNRTV